MGKMNNNQNQKDRFYAITLDFTREPGMIPLIEDDIKGFNEYRFAAAQIINDWPSGIVFYFEGNRVADYWKPRLSWNLVSDQVKIIFQKHQIEGVQYLPVKAINKKSGDSYQYWVLNVIRRVADLRKKHVHDLSIFRLRNNKGGALPEIYISGQLRQYLENEGAISGFGFRPVSERTLDKE